MIKNKLKKSRIFYSPQKSLISGNSENNVFRVFRKNRRFFQKKAVIETSTLVLYIILVATTLTLAGAVAMYTKLATKDAAKKACEFDINKAVLSKQVPAVEKLLTRGHQQTALTNCRRDKLGNLEIKYKDIVEDGVINQDKAHKIIADEMVECWKMAGAGTKDPFKNWDVKGESYCMICSTIKFDERLIDLYNKGIQKDPDGENVMTAEDIKKYRILSVYPYLATKEVEPGKNIWEFLYNEKALNYQDIKSKYENKYLVPGTTIIIQMHKFEDVSTWEMVLGGVGILGGVILSSTGIGAVIGVPLIAGIVGGLGVVGGFVGIAAVVVEARQAYSCDECNGIGGIQLVPPQEEFNIQIPIKIGDTEKQIPLCSIIVN